MDASTPESEFVPSAPPPDGCCCWPLWNRLTAAGERGLAVVVEEGPDQFRFWLQSRGVDVDGERTFGASPALSDLHINVATSIRIRYCAWCGSHLGAVAASAPDTFARFAAGHREFAPPPV